MADNIDVTPGSGQTVLADEIVHGTLGTGIVQLVKIVDGAIGGTTEAGVDADGLKVNLGDDNDVTVTSGNITADLGATDNAVLDDIAAQATTVAGAVSGSEMQVDVITMPTTTVTGTVTANLSATDNTVLDNIDADLTTIAGAVSGSEMQVDVVTAPTTTVVGNTNVFDWGPSLHTSALAEFDVLADTEALSAICRANDAPITLQAITVIDADANPGSAIDIILMSANNGLGIEGAAVDMTAGESEDIQAVIQVAATDFVDFVNASVANIRNLSIPLLPAPGTDDIYVAIRGGASNTNDYAADSLTIRFHYFQD